MIKNRVYIIFLSALFLFISSCQEIYNPENLDSSKRIVVINGIITNKIEPYRVSIFYANAFNNNSKEPITGAKVYIKDDEDNSKLLKDFGNGNYYSDTAEIIGTIGRKYFIHVELSDGSVYESIPEIMYAPPQVDSMYAEIGKHDQVEYDSYGDIVITPYKGLDVKIDFNSTTKGYYRVSSNVITQKSHIESTSFGSVDVFCWYNSNLNDFPDVVSALPDGLKYVVRDHDMGFLALVNGTDTRIVNRVTYSPEQIAGWVVSTTVSTISADAYSYYQSVANQLEAANRIFDPVPSQIVGNIHCINNPSKIVLGLFEVSSNVLVNEAFSWNDGSKIYHKKNLMSYPSVIVDGCLNNSYPAFWVQL